MYTLGTTASGLVIDQYQREMREAAAQRHLARQAQQRNTRRPIAGTWRNVIQGPWTGATMLDSA